MVHECELEKSACELSCALEATPSRSFAGRRRNHQAPWSKQQAQLQVVSIASTKFPKRIDPTFGGSAEEGAQCVAEVDLCSVLGPEW